MDGFGWYWMVLDGMVLDGIGNVRVVVAVAWHGPSFPEKPPHSPRHLSGIKTKDHQMKQP